MRSVHTNPPARQLQRAGSSARNKRNAYYFGLVPRQDASGDKNRLGHVTREGPPTVRKLLAKKLARSEMEKEILKKATAFFASQNL